jgi:hypothetical protein
MSTAITHYDYATGKTTVSVDKQEAIVPQRVDYVETPEIVKETFNRLRSREVVPRTKRLSIQQAFEEWLINNPKVFGIFLGFAREVQATGKTHYGIAAITERVRWFVNIESVGESFKINNNFRSRMVRRLVEEDPSLSNLFQTRKLKSA